MQRRILTMMLVIALAVAWLVYSFLATFENWPWTMRHTYRSGTFDGVTIGSTKAATMEQILLRQSQGALDSVPEAMFTTFQPRVTSNCLCGGPYPSVTYNGGGVKGGFVWTFARRWYATVDTGVANPFIREENRE